MPRSGSLRVPTIYPFVFHLIVALPVKLGVALTLAGVVELSDIPIRTGVLVAGLLVVDRMQGAYKCAPKTAVEPCLED